MPFFFWFWYLFIVALIYKYNLIHIPLKVFTNNPHITIGYMANAFTSLRDKTEIADIILRDIKDTNKVDVYFIINFLQLMKVPPLTMESSIMMFNDFITIYGSNLSLNYKNISSKLNLTTSGKSNKQLKLQVALLYSMRQDFRMFSFYILHHLFLFFFFLFSRQ